MDRRGVSILAVIGIAIGIALGAAVRAQEQKPPPAPSGGEEKKTPEAKKDPQESSGAKEGEQEEEPDQAKPKRVRVRGPEFEKLDVFIGTWKGDLDVHADTTEEIKKTTAEMTFQSTCDGFFLVADYVQKPPKGLPVTYKAHAAFTFDAEVRKYRMWWFDNEGKIQDGHGIWKDNTIQFQFDLRWGGKKVKMVTTFTIVSESEFQFKMENSFEDDPLRPVIEATYRKQS